MKYGKEKGCAVAAATPLEVIKTFHSAIDPSTINATGDLTQINFSSGGASHA